MIDYLRLTRIQFCGVPFDCCPTIEQMKLIQSLTANAGDDSEWEEVRKALCKLCPGQIPLPPIPPGPNDPPVIIITQDPPPVPPAVDDCDSINPFKGS